MRRQAHLEQRIPAFVDYDPDMPGMEDLILDYLARHKKATFTELEDELPGFSGDLVLKWPGNRKTVLWRDVSEAAVHALFELEKQGKIAFEPTSCRTYQHKGRRLYLPVDDDWESNKLHWIPVIVTLKPAVH